MPVVLKQPEICEASGALILEARVSGTLTKENYEALENEFERALEAGAKIRIIIILDNFDGWTMKAMWEDVKFDVKHFNDVDRIAVVGDTTAGKIVTTLFKPFTAAEVRYFEAAEDKAAHDWIAAP